MTAPLLKTKVGRVKRLNHPDSAPMLCNEESLFAPSPKRMVKDSGQKPLTLEWSEVKCLDSVLPLRDLQEAFAHLWLGPSGSGS
jgi:hypothetical protein